MTRLCRISMVLLLASVAFAQNQPRILIEQALDQATELTIEDLSLAEAFGKIADKTGLTVTIGPDALDFLPYGTETRVSVHLENIKLRAGIEAICRQLAMTYFTTDLGVEIIPSEPLFRLGQRASWQEIDTVSRLMDTKWGPESDYAEIKDLVRFKSPTTGDPYTWDKLEANLKTAGSGGAVELLSLACEAMQATWFPWENGVVVLPITEQTARQLQRPVSLRHNSQPLIDVLQSLGRQAGLRITIDPTAAAGLSSRIKQSFSLLVEGATVEEALDQIAVASGLTYRIDGTQIVFQSSDQQVAKTTAVPSRRSDPIVGKIVIPGPDGSYQYEFFIRESDLTEKERELRQKMIEKARKAMETELAD